MKTLYIADLTVFNIRKVKILYDTKNTIVAADGRRMHKKTKKHYIDTFDECKKYLLDYLRRGKSAALKEMERFGMIIASIEVMEKDDIDVSDYKGYPVWGDNPVEIMENNIV